ncbi:hypothetical protein LL253_02000 [Sphingobium soli]|uniref:Transposase n=1 Tax=Sphingobium soli TaxID=1591116 RepID=A0ABS8GYW1_9SPHN|nr:hypothetical protein [Sphingobium soli]MCC4231460.1 hypothetical protein [Sphingobium soli]
MMQALMKKKRCSRFKTVAADTVFVAMMPPHMPDGRDDIIAEGDRSI